MCAGLWLGASCGIAAVRQGVAELILHVYVMFTLGDLRMSITVKAAWDPDPGAKDCTLLRVATGNQERAQFEFENGDRR